MVSVDDAVIARLKKEGRVFEILVDCEKALDFKSGAEIDMSDILASEMIFKDARKGLVAADLNEVFGTEDPREIAGQIIKKGDVQLTAEYRRKLQESKKRQIISKIAQYAMDTRTKKPVPETRIELAMEEIKVHIDPFKSVDEQIKEVINALRPILPISTEEIVLRCIFPPEFAAKAYGVVEKLGTIKKNTWLADGSWEAYIQLPAGMQDEFYDKVNSLTQGRVDIRIEGDKK
jgi:ribosome maturation protein SDO1